MCRRIVWEALVYRSGGRVLIKIDLMMHFGIRSTPPILIKIDGWIVDPGYNSTLVIVAVLDF
jgi:hypothetical protein